MVVFMYLSMGTVQGIQSDILQACFKQTFPLVTLYTNLGEKAIADGINQTEVIQYTTTRLFLRRGGGLSCDRRFEYGEYGSLLDPHSVHLLEPDPF
jgi:hypothetical protein